MGQLKAYKTELRPNKAQTEFLARCCAASRWAYNWCLGERSTEYKHKQDVVLKALEVIRQSSSDRQATATVLSNTRLKKDQIPELVEALNQYERDLTYWKEHPSPPKKRPTKPSLKINTRSLNDLKKELRRHWRKGTKQGDLFWLGSVPSSVIDYAFIHLGNAFTNFFRRVQQGRRPFGYPRFKKYRKGHGSFSLISGGGLDVMSDRIRLVNIGYIRLKERGYLPVGKNKRGITVTEHSGRWYVSTIADFDPVQLPQGRPSVGIDVNLVNFATLSDGTIVDNPEYLKRELKRLRRLNKSLARKKIIKGRPSANREKARARLNKQHKKVADARKHFLHTLTTDLVRKYGLIAVETLGIQDMMNKTRKGPRLARRIADASWYEFRRQLEYKGEWYGSVIVAVSRWFPSTKQCSSCGSRMSVSWTTRLCKCSSCGLEVDMDKNAAVNLCEEALLEVYKSSQKED